MDSPLVNASSYWFLANIHYISGMQTGQISQSLLQWWGLKWNEWEMNRCGYTVPQLIKILSCQTVSWNDSQLSVHKTIPKKCSEESLSSSKQTAYMLHATLSWWIFMNANCFSFLSSSLQANINISLRQRVPVLFSLFLIIISSLFLQFHFFSSQVPLCHRHTLPWVS